MHQVRFRLPDPAGGAYSAPSDPLAEFKGPTSNGGAVSNGHSVELAISRSRVQVILGGKTT